MPFKRFVETGRVAWISGGRYAGRLCSIVDVIDQTRVLVDGPKTGVPRIPIRLNQIRLTKFLIKFPFKGSTRVVRKAWEASKFMEKWKAGKWSGNLSKRKLRRKMSDFDRFKLRNARKARNALRTAEYLRLMKAAKRRSERLRRSSAKWRISKKLGKPIPDKPKKKSIVKKKLVAKKVNGPKPKKLKTVKSKAKATKGDPKASKPTAAKPKVEKSKATTGKASAKPQK